jgi:hypothetical protein
MKQNEDALDRSMNLVRKHQGKTWFEIASLVIAFIIVAIFVHYALQAIKWNGVWESQLENRQLLPHKIYHDPRKSQKIRA